MKNFSQWLRSDSYIIKELTDAEIEAEIKKTGAPPLSIKKGPSPPAKDDDDYDPYAIGGKDAKGQGASKDAGTGTGSGTTPAKKGDKLKTAPPLPDPIEIKTHPEPKGVTDTPKEPKNVGKSSPEPDDKGTSGDAGSNPFRNKGGGFGTSGDKPQGGTGGDQPGRGPGNGGTGSGSGTESPKKEPKPWIKTEYGTY